MPSTVENKDGSTMLIEFLGILGSFAILLMIYAHHEKLLRFLRRVFRLRRGRSALSNVSSDKNRRQFLQDLESGRLGVLPEHLAGQNIEPDSLARILAYLNGLPCEADEYMTMREVSIHTGSLEDAEGETCVGSSSVGDERRSSVGGSLESNWVEIIQNFPSPPEATLLRRLLEERGITGLGISGLDTGDVVPAGDDNASDSGRPSGAASPRSSERGDLARPDSDNGSSSTIRPSLNSDTSSQVVEVSHHSIHEQ